MSNRSLAFLILIAICSSILGFVYYFFIANVGNLTFEISWVNEVKVVINWEFGNSNETLCETKCTFSNIPPINYAVKIEKEWYKSYANNIKLERWENKIVKVKIEKEVQTEAVKVSTESKIKALKYKKYLTSKEEDSWEKLDRTEIWTYNSNIYSYSNNKWFFDIYTFDWDKESDVLNIENIKISNISINTVDWIIFYSTKDGNFFYDINNNTNYKLDIEDEIVYIKKTATDDKYIINSKMWVYIYNTTTNESTKNTLYDDFVILEDARVIWLIKDTSKDKLSILNFENNWKNKLVLHNIETKDKKIIYETTSNIEHIFYKDWIIKYIDENGNLFNITELNLK